MRKPDPVSHFFKNVVLKKYIGPFMHVMDSVILEDGIDEVCERVYGEKQKK